MTMNSTRRRCWDGGLGNRLPRRSWKVCFMSRIPHRAGRLCGLVLRSKIWKSGISMRREDISWPTLGIHWWMYVLFSFCCKKPVKVLNALTPWVFLFRNWKWEMNQIPCGGLFVICNWYRRSTLPHSGNMFYPYQTRRPGMKLLSDYDEVYTRSLHIRCLLQIFRIY